jgi:long-chain acyl-CoA synthetase
MAARPFEPRPAEGLAYPNVIQMFEARVARSPDRPALRHKRDGAWQTFTWRDWHRAARQIAAGLIAGLGIERGDRIAIMARTRLEWTLCDTAVALVGAISVSIHETLSAQDATHILRDSGAVALIVEHADDLRRVARPELRGRLSSLRQVIHIETAVETKGEDEGGQRLAHDGLADIARHSLDSIREAGAAAGTTADAALERARQEIGLEDEFTCVYTSGTTGTPRGVVLTHKNLVYEAWAIRAVVPVDGTDEQLMVLPCAHIFGRHLIWGAVEQGAVTSFARSLDALDDDLLEVAPTYIGAAPIVYERIYRRILAEVAGDGLKRRLFWWAYEIGRKVSTCQQRGQVLPPGLTLRLAAAQRLVLGRIQAMFGGRLRFAVCGGAPLCREVVEFFHAVGILVLEGYGLTETTGATSANRPDRYRFGSVGPAMPGCELRIADDGEILVRGHNVMAGYHEREDETRATIDEHRWLHTGDIGEITDGFLRITDRKSDLILTSGARHIAPAPIENRLKVKPGISHAVVHGDRKPHAVALVVLDHDTMMELSEREGLGCRNYHDLAHHPRIRQVVEGYVDEVNATLAPFEAIRAFAVAPAEFAVATGELTPTLKLRRSAVNEKYRDLFEALYDERSTSPLVR